MKKRVLSFLLSFCFAVTTCTVSVSAKEPQNVARSGSSVSAYNESGNNEKISVYNAALGKKITYVKWNGQWAAVINTKEDLDKYLQANKDLVKQAMKASYSNQVFASENRKVSLAASNNYTNDVLVRSVGGLFHFDCRCYYEVTNNKITRAEAYGILTNFTWGVSYEQTNSTAKIIDNGKTVDCFIAGVITNSLIYKSVGEVYKCNVTSGGYVHI